MKLLILTQVVDEGDTVLGFFTQWIKKLASHVDSMEVVALKVGEYQLPSNVHVHSLEKEIGSNRVRRLWLFYRYVFSLIHEYDVVFVHMNQEYVLLAGILWKLWGKKIFLWRNHPRGSWLTRLAVWLSDKVFYTASQSFTAQFAKSRKMPAGVDLEVFHPSLEYTEKNSVLLFGRVAPIKRLHLAIDACVLLRAQGVPITLSIVGDVSKSDNEYFKRLQNQVASAGATDWITFSPGVPFTQAPEVFRRHRLFINCTESGSFDKTVLEALASALVVVTTNESMKTLLPPGSYAEATSDALAQAIQLSLTRDVSAQEVYNGQAAQVVVDQSLDSLIHRLSTSLME